MSLTSWLRKCFEVEQKVVPVSDSVKEVMHSQKPVEEKENIPEKPVEVAKEQFKPKTKEKQAVKKKSKKGKERVVAELDPSIAVDVAEMAEWKDLFVLMRLSKHLLRRELQTQALGKLWPLVFPSFRVSWEMGGMRRFMQNRKGVRK